MIVNNLISTKSLFIFHNLLIHDYLLCWWWINNNIWDFTNKYRIEEGYLPTLLKTQTCSPLNLQVIHLLCVGISSGKKFLSLHVKGMVHQMLHEWSIIAVKLLKCPWNVLRSWCVTQRRYFVLHWLSLCLFHQQFHPYSLLGTEELCSIDTENLLWRKQNIKSIVDSLLIPSPPANNRGKCAYF